MRAFGAELIEHSDFQETLEPALVSGVGTYALGLFGAVPICGASHIVTVSEEESQAAMQHIFTDTHNVAESAGAATAGRRVALILTSGNVDTDMFAHILSQT